VHPLTQDVIKALNGVRVRSPICSNDTLRRASGAGEGSATLMLRRPQQEEEEEVSRWGRLKEQRAPVRGKLPAVAKTFVDYPLATSTYLGNPK